MKNIYFSQIMNYAQTTPPPPPNLYLRSPNKPDLGHCMINALTQKGWSLHVPLHISYLDVEEDSSHRFGKVTAKIFPMRWPHPLTSAEALPSYQVLNMQEEYIRTGKYDKNLLYDTAQLVSFPGMKLDNSNHATIIQLSLNREETIQMRIAIPQDFPNDLVAKPVFVDILSKIEDLGSEASLTLCILVIG